MSAEIFGRWTSSRDDKKRAYMSEKNLWRVFHCLAKAIMAMSCGDENGPRRKRRRWDRLIHLDLKVC